MKMAEGKDNLEFMTACSVCHRVKIDGEWTEVSPEQYEDFRRTKRLSHGPCSAECISKGYKLPIEKAREIYDRAMKREQGE